MCGITGFWSFSSTNIAFEDIVQKMADQLTTRGPDSRGVWYEKGANIAFGHRRLAIIDLSQTGHQPMTSSSGRFVITYNGEVYNAFELRQELLAKGYMFRGSSDTEVILAACEEYGIEHTAKKLIGMFAYGLWDRKEHKLHLVRDRLGVKPLYWGLHNDTLFFASQLKSFRPHPLWRPQLNKQALISYFRFGYVPAPLSIYSDIQKLSPGCIATIQGKEQIKITPYWSMSEAMKQGRIETSDCSASEWIDQLHSLLKKAVKSCMISDVPTGAFLSGGIDSSVVTALMQTQSSNPIETFSIGFREEKYNEAIHAAAIAQHLGTNHHELYVNSSDALNIIPSIADWCDEPFGDSSQIPTFLVSRLAQRHVKVCLSGDGGDEFFVGYNRYFQSNQAWNYLSKIPLSLRKIIANCIMATLPAQWDSLKKLTPAHEKLFLLVNKIHNFSRILTAPGRKALYLKIISHWDNPADLVLGSQEKLSPLWSPCKGDNDYAFIEEMQYIDSMTYLPADILSKVDYASMAVGLECRVPLLDHRVVEWSWSVPLNLKRRHSEGKLILREVLKKYVPPPLFDRPKMGFGIPLDQWLRGPLRSWAEELLSVRRLSEEGLLNPVPIRQRWEGHLSGVRNWQYSLWTVLMFQAWREQYSLS